MPSHVFISCSRDNAPFAERLRLDLERAGATGWLDNESLQWGGPPWRLELVAAIEGATHVVVLASPESALSAEVRKECEYARERGKPLLPLLIAGAPEQLPEEWRALQLADFRGGYWKQLPRLLRVLGAAQQALPTPEGLLDGPGETFRSVGEKLTGHRVATAAGRSFVGVPAGGSAYTSTWLVGEADAPFHRPAAAQVLLKFSGRAERSNTLAEVLEFLTAAVPSPALIFVQGPRERNGDYNVPLAASHVWEHSIRAVGEAIHGLAAGRPLDFFVEAPWPLAFAVGAQLRELVAYRLYHLDRAAAAQERYRLVFAHRPT